MSTLCIDDEDSFLSVVSAQLKLIDLIRVSTFSDAWDCLNTHRIERIVSDFKMDGQSKTGGEFILEVKKLYPDLPCNIYTGAKSTIDASMKEELQRNNVEIFDKHEDKFSTAIGLPDDSEFLKSKLDGFLDGDPLEFEPDNEIDLLNNFTALTDTEKQAVYSFHQALVEQQRNKLEITKKTVECLVDDLLEQLETYNGGVLRRGGAIFADRKYLREIQNEIRELTPLGIEVVMANVEVKRMRREAKKKFLFNRFRKWLWEKIQMETNRW